MSGNTAITIVMGIGAAIIIAFAACATILTVFACPLWQIIILWTFTGLITLFWFACFSVIG